MAATYSELYPGRKPIGHPGMSDSPYAAEQLAAVRDRRVAEVFAVVLDEDEF